jgi:hypothetical protein
MTVKNNHIKSPAAGIGNEAKNSTQSGKESGTIERQHHESLESIFVVSLEKIASLLI